MKKTATKFLIYVAIISILLTSMLVMHNIQISKIIGVKLPNIEKSVFLSKSRVKTSTKEEAQTEAIVKNDCVPSRSLVYVKTHKTGSSTLRAILARHKRRYELSNQTQVMTFPAPFFGGYPGRFLQNLTVIPSSNLSKIDVPPDYLLGHFRFDEEEVRSLMNPNAKYITILRNPLKAFESSFHYYYGKHTEKSVKNLQAVTCHPEPYLQVAKKYEVSYPDYLAMAENSLHESIAWYFRSRNYQSFDLGLDPTINGKDYVLSMAKKLDAVFDLVLITDHLLESLILMKEVLCMSWEDIVPPTRNKGTYESHTYSVKEKQIASRLNNQDLVLYDYFNATLWKKIDSYGRKRMEDDVNTLKEYIKQANTRKDDNKKKRHRRSTQTINKNEQDANKRHYATATDALISSILKKRGHNSVNINKIREIAIHMSKNSGWCPPSPGRLSLD
uniref:galactosylceramide sulfotransferase-like n=1 Tax=Styela clava TaxID=7725 RepID=UPI00193A8674|nr:galactosylceramide sulfotransferase-like [Styela clava]